MVRWLTCVHITVVSPAVVPPTEVNPNPLPWDALKGLIQDPDMEVHDPLPGHQTKVLELGVSAHGKVRAVYLQGKAAGHNGPILHCHGLPHRRHVRGVGGVERLGTIVEEHGHGSWRRACPEGLSRQASIVASERLTHFLTLLLQLGLADIGYLPNTHGVAGPHTLVQCNEPSREQKSARHAVKLLQILRLRSWGIILVCEACHALHCSGGVIPSANLSIIDVGDTDVELLLHHLVKLSVLVFRCSCPREGTHVGGLDHIWIPWHGPGFKEGRTTRATFARNLKGHSACGLFHLLWRADAICLDFGALGLGTCLLGGSTASHIGLHVCPGEFSPKVARQVSGLDRQGLLNAKEELGESQRIDPTDENLFLGINIPGDIGNEVPK